MSRRNKNIGDWGEVQACLFLERHNFVIVERNFYTTQGEIDIVATHAGDYYFIEVKTRQQEELGNDLAVTKAKKYKLGKTMKRYCYQHSLTEGSFILASLLVVINRPIKHVSFRLAAYC